ncbi:MAG: hypothetical protein HOE90_07220 [Bacteriovoracaceae bacterium]|jgi:hypothetical protein|nr:hypothetical protein [Bacteriovoracaceae bacterium]
MSNWGKHPFNDQTKFKVFSPAVKVFGIGKDISDTKATAAPSLVFVRASVSVLSATTYNLTNPNGWYCFKGKVNVLGKTTINTHCKSHLSSVSGDLAILGKGEKVGAGTTVLGKTIVKRKCD